MTSAEIPTTAATRSRLIRRVMTQAGYAGQVTSSPASHRAQQTMIRPCDDQQKADIAAYLAGYLGQDAKVAESNWFVVINWQTERP